VARRRTPAPPASPAARSSWLLTLSDLMTLMLTFFIMLTAMGTIDEHRRQAAMGAVGAVFGAARAPAPAPADPRPTPPDMAAAPEKSGDLAPLRDLAEARPEDLNFTSNAFMQVLSIADQALFEPGQARLSPEGRRLLEAMAPVLRQVRRPLLLAGHAAGESLAAPEAPGRRDPSPRDTSPRDPSPRDLSWRLSLERAQAVYSVLLDQGLDPRLLRLEAFGRFRPRYGDRSPEDQRRNRRVDLVLDSRNLEWVGKLPPRLTPEGRRGVFSYRGFEFKLDGAGPARPRP
jgi:chemotaxis protein MotB